MGTPDFAVPALDAILKAGHNVIAVYSQPPRPAGRGKKPQLSAVHQFAAEKGLKILTPENFKSAAAKEEFKNLGADIAVVAAYGLILPTAVLDAPRLGCINIHASLLPRWRGAAPIQRAILAGDSKSGVAIMQMEKGLDTGPVLMMDEVAITPATTATSLHDALATMGGRLIVKTLAAFAADAPPKAVPQSELGGETCYAAMLTREEGQIDWTENAEVIERKIRALTPWPGVWCLYAHGSKRLKIHASAIAASSSSAAPGTILDKKLTIACGNGTALTLASVQPEGKKAMDGGSFLNGGAIAIGDILQ
ncbi:MAG: methionyl-tRNA formyltransferase [Alphaproteobacteria bacterium]|nr:MAG: methionyl-tRNA formyltransferase [Alphaproteobacteria bacterium]